MAATDPEVRLPRLEKLLEAISHEAKLQKVVLDERNQMALEAQQEADDEGEILDQLTSAEDALSDLIFDIKLNAS